MDKNARKGHFLQNGFKNYTYHDQPPAYTFSMPKPLAKGGKPARVDTSTALLEANKAANNNPKLIKLPITAIGEWSDALQAFVIKIDPREAATGYALSSNDALVPSDSPYISTKHNLLTKTGHPAGPTFFKAGDIALCEIKITPVTVEEDRFVQGLGRVTAKHQRDEVTFVFKGWVVGP